MVQVSNASTGDTGPWPIAEGAIVALAEESKDSGESCTTISCVSASL